MAAVVEVVSDTFEAVGDAVGAVGEAIGDAAQEVGNFVEDTAQSVGKTVEAIANDPAKALPLIAVAIAAPYVAPYLWAGATTAQAAMVLNTGLALANGADPMQVAQNIGTSMITQGITANLPVDLSTGSSFADQAIANTAVAAAQGRDPAQALGSMIGNAAIRYGTNEIAGGVRDYAGLDDTTAPVTDRSESYTPPTETIQTAETNIPSDDVTMSQTFRDAIQNGFSPEESYAIAKGQMDAEQSGPSPYAKTASTITSDQPQASVTVTGADDVQGEGVSLPAPSKEELDQDLADGKITQEEYDRMAPTATEAKSALDYVDPYQEESPIDATGEDFDMSAPVPEPKEIVSDGLENQKPDTRGNLIYTYDDGSTLTLSPDGEVIDVTEATDVGGLGSLDGTGEDFDMGGPGGTGEDFDMGGEYQEEEYTETPDEKSGSGFSVKFGRPGLSRAATIRKGMVAKPTRPTRPTPGANESAADPGLLLNSQYGSQLTSNVLAGDPGYNLIGSIAEEEPQGMASGGSATQGVYDLSYTASSPFLSSGSDIMALKPGLIKPKVNYELPGYPYGKEWKAAKEGGPIGHNPEFFSEGGLNSLKNSYVKGKGDGTSDSIPAMLANGEFVIPADVVSSLGNGSNDSGAEILSEFLKTIREHKRRADSRKLPPDSKGALGYLTEAKKKVKK
jgi:hypothetical protein